MSEWMPIETAPKDGTEVLVYYPDWGIVISAYDKPESIDIDEEWEGYWLDDDEIEPRDNGPTHWMPLPPKPSP